MNIPSTPTPQRQKRATPAQRQAHILEAAHDAFAAHGFAAARVEDIARRAKVSKGTVYLYFPTKAALFEALVRRDITPRVAMMRAFLRLYNGPLSAALTTVAEMAISMIEGGTIPIYPKLLLAEASRFPELAHFYRREVFGVVIEAFSDLFARAIERKDIRDADPLVLTHLFISPFIKSALWRLTFGADVNVHNPPVAAVLRAHIEHFLTSLSLVEKDRP
jgi:AcrR family transcriptional regulator